MYKKKSKINACVCGCVGVGIFFTSDRKAYCVCARCGKRTIPKKSISSAINIWNSMVE